MAPACFSCIAVRLPHQSPDHCLDPLIYAQAPDPNPPPCDPPRPALPLPHRLTLPLPDLRTLALFLTASEFT